MQNVGREIMNSYEKIIKVIRDESNRGKNAPIRLGVVDKEKISVGMLELEKEDFLINSELSLKDGDQVLVVLTQDIFVIVCKVVTM